MEKITEQSLVMRCREGDLGAFDILYRKYSIPLVGFLDRMIHDTGLAEDMFQETFIRVLENIERYNPAYRFSTWIYKIATNLCINELKRRKRETFIPASHQAANGGVCEGSTENRIASEDGTPLEHLEFKETREFIQSLLDMLPDKCRVSFLLRFYYDMTYDDIAYIEDCAVGTIKSRVHYGLQHIRKMIREESQCTKKLK